MVIAYNKERRWQSRQMGWSH